jgi:glutamate--cysteine ligase
LPLVLQNCETAIFPSVQLGWFLRSKAKHFEMYSQLAEEVAKILEIDPWLISTFSQKVSSVNFKQQSGLENLASEVDKLLIKISEKYRQFGIEEKPGCFIKADNGTYGMAVWLVYSGDEIRNINKKERNKMNIIKGNVQNTHVIIQEGILTIDRVKNIIAEPMIYLVNGQVVGNLFRVNESRDNMISLNAAGMSFYDIDDLNDDELFLGLPKNEVVKIYSLIARLAALAASSESY